MGLVPPFDATLFTCRQGVTENSHASVFPLSCLLPELVASVTYGHRPQKAAQDMLGTCETAWGEWGDETAWNWVNQ